MTFESNPPEQITFEPSENRKNTHSIDADSDPVSSTTNNNEDVLFIKESNRNNVLLDITDNEPDSTSNLNGIIDINFNINSLDKSGILESRIKTESETSCICVVLPPILNPVISLT